MASAPGEDRRRSPERKRPLASDPATPPFVRRVAVENFQKRSISDVFTVSIDPCRSRGCWEGWGISLCWWAATSWPTPTPDVIADLLFTLKEDIHFQTTTFGAYRLPGLGMTIARYNAGASGPEMHPTNMKASRTMDGFWVRPDKWDWNRDRHQIEMLGKAQERGANLFELFANSPLWWMCHTKNPSGSLSGTRDNLLPQHYSDFARYLIEIVVHAQTEWGIKFEYIAPFNEPCSIWWNMSNNQEGCHFEHNSQARLVKIMKDVIKIAHSVTKDDSSLKRLLGSLKIAASDENTYDQAIDTWDSLDSDAQDAISKINVHGYQKGNGLRNELYKRAAASKKTVWTSEYGDADETGLTLATNLILDFHQLHCTAWAYWQALDSGGWGLVQANPGDKWVGKPNAKLFVLAHYSRHIRPGMRILDIDIKKGGTHEPKGVASRSDSDEMAQEANSVAAYSDSEEKLVLVTANQDRLRLIRYDLSLFQASGSSAEVSWWSTDIDVAHVTCGKATEKPTAYIAAPKKHLDLKADPTLEVLLDSNTICTFEIHGLQPRTRKMP